MAARKPARGCLQQLRVSLPEHGGHQDAPQQPREQIHCVTDGGRAVIKRYKEASRKATERSRGTPNALRGRQSGRPERLPADRARVQDIPERGGPRRWRKGPCSPEWGGGGGVFTQGRAAEALATCHQNPFARPNAVSAHLCA